MAEKTCQHTLVVLDKEKLEISLGHPNDGWSTLIKIKLQLAQKLGSDVQIFTDVFNNYPLSRFAE